MAAVLLVWAVYLKPDSTKRPVLARILQPPNFLGRGRGRLFSPNLRAMHDAPCLVVEGISPMHCGAVVPHYEIAGSPMVLPAQCLSGCDLPYLVEQRVGLLEREALNIGVASAA